MDKIYSNKILFAAGPHSQLLPIFACGEYAEVELQEYGTEREWSDCIPDPPDLGLWVWEFDPTGGGRTYDGDYDDVDIDRGIWRPLDYREWHFIQNNEVPWAPMTNVYEELTPVCDDLFSTFTKV